jgi:hypothetical protein
MQIESSGVSIIGSISFGCTLVAGIKNAISKAWPQENGFFDHAVSLFVGVFFKMIGLITRARSSYLSSGR